MLHKTAILVFSRTPEVEALSKTLATGHDNNLAACNFLYKKTVDTAKATGLSVIVSNQDSQSGGSFAEKITDAIAKTFCKGFSRLIVIGADCPNLTKSHINKAHAALLAGQDVVAGRDCRGGVYLLAVDKAAFNEAEFRKFNWQTGKLYNDIVTYTAPYNFIRLAPVLGDMNFKRDTVKSFSLVACNQQWKNLLRGFLVFFQQKQMPGAVFCGLAIFAVTPVLRGPPAGC